MLKLAPSVVFEFPSEGMEFLAECFHLTALCSLDVLGPLLFFNRFLLLEWVWLNVRGDGGF